ncbi:hypothetical protein KGM_200485 [Danaus plexippus plexippus]|uniref:Uncharacterized protein n=1 Tax=Danaus plexippus plexippus TaxID=278856 RepID=A0A212EYJ8_DANPL|nr:hypothetical protein KGM_200485 [Danaus plexippus plexippus]
MSFDLIMEPNKDERVRKSHRGLLQMFRPGGCLSIHNDEEEYSYMPGTSNELNRSSSGQEDFHVKTTNEAFSLKKNVFSPSYTTTFKTPKPFLGKCKPGGCLDPPFGEEKYIYKPTFEDNQIAEKSPHTNDINKMLLDSDKNKPELGIKKQTLDQEVEDLHESYTDLTENIEDSESLVTYPLPVSSSYIKNRDSQSKKDRSRINSEQTSQKLTNEFPVSFFMPPRKEKTKQFKTYDDYNDKETKVKEAYINNEYAMQSQTPSEMFSDSLTTTHPSREEPSQDVTREQETSVKSIHSSRNDDISKEPVKSEGLDYISDIKALRKGEEIFSQEQVTANDKSGTGNQNIRSKLPESHIDTSYQSDKMNSIQKMEVENIVSEDKNIEPEKKHSSANVKLSSEKLKINSLSELNNHSDNSEINSIADKPVEGETGLRNGINNLLDPIEKEKFKKNSLKYETSKDFGVNVGKHDSTNLIKPNLKFSHEELTKTSIDDPTKILTYSSSESINDKDIKIENQLRDGVESNLDPTQKEMFEKDSLKYEALRHSKEIITNDDTIKVRKSNVKLSKEDLAEISMDQLNRFSKDLKNESITDINVKRKSQLPNKTSSISDPMQKDALKYEAVIDSGPKITNEDPIQIEKTDVKLGQEEITKISIDQLTKLIDQAENEIISDTSAKSEIRLTNELSNLLHPATKEVFEKDSLTYKDLKDSSKITLQSSDGDGISNIKNFVPLQKKSLDSNDNAEVNLKEPTKNLDEIITLPTEKLVFQNKTSVNEDFERHSESSNKINNKVSDIAIKSLSSKISLNEKTADLNLENLSKKSSKYIVFEKPLSAGSDDLKETSLENKSSTFKDLPTNNIDSKSMLISYEENHDIDNDKNGSLRNISLKQEINQSSSHHSRDSQLSLLKKLSSLPQIQNSEGILYDNVQDKNTFDNSSHEFTDSNILRTGQYLNNTPTKIKDGDREGIDLKQNILLHKGLDNNLDEWIRKDEKSFQNYVTNNVNEDILSTSQTNDFIEDSTQLDKGPRETVDHELMSLKSGNRDQGISKDYAKSQVYDSSSDIKHTSSSIFLNFAFHSLANEFGYTITTLDPTTDLTVYPQNKITTIKTALKENDKEIRIRMDSETDIIIQIKRNHKRNEGSKSIVSNEGRNLMRGYCSETIINKDQFFKNTLKTVYDTLVPIEKIISNLKEEADVLYREQLLLRKILSSREMKSKRIIRTNKNCSCLEKEMGIK